MKITMKLIIKQNEKLGAESLLYVFENIERIKTKLAHTWRKGKEEKFQRINFQVQTLSIIRIK